MLNLDEIRGRLAGREIHWSASVGSTMHEACRLAAAGAASGTVIGADEQTAGQGRLGRSWHSQAGTGLYLSLILRLPFTPETLPLVTMALGLGVREAIVKVTGVSTDLRWPNDVLIDDRKVAGIGVNVDQREFPPDLADIATSLRIVCGREQSREDLLVAILPAVEEMCGVLLQEGTYAILRLFAASSSYVPGRRVVIDVGDEELRGTTAVLSAAGFLLVRDDAGTEHTIIAGGVRPA